MRESLDALSPLMAVDPTLLSILGMAAVGAGIIGAPLAMTFLALEATADFRIMVAALLASALSGLIVREAFGYSFATWRFHLRGEAIRGPQDIGWVRDLKVSRLMRKDFRAVAADRTIAAARILFPSASPRNCSSPTRTTAYVGTVLVSDLHAEEFARMPRRVDTLAHWRRGFPAAAIDDPRRPRPVRKERGRRAARPRGRAIAPDRGQIVGSPCVARIWPRTRKAQSRVH